MYLDEIGRIPLLGAAEEVELAKRIEAGVFAAERRDAMTQRDVSKAGHDPRLSEELDWIIWDGRRAKNQLVRANLRLVVSIANHYRDQGLALSDLIQEGNLGLIRAVEMFDYTKGNKFSTYAAWWIRDSIVQAIGNHGRTIRIPVRATGLIKRLARIEAELRGQLGREATVEELANEARLSADRVRQLGRLARAPVSLDLPVGENRDSRLGDFIVDFYASGALDVVAHALLRSQVRAVIAALPRREARVLELRYGLADAQPRTYKEIASIMRLDRDTVRHIEAKTLVKLRESGRCGRLHGYLD